MGIVALVALTQFLKVMQCCRNRNANLVVLKKELMQSKDLIEHVWDRSLKIVAVEVERLNILQKRECRKISMKLVLA